MFGCCVYVDLTAKNTFVPTVNINYERERQTVHKILFLNVAQLVGFRHKFEFYFCLKSCRPDQTYIVILMFNM